MRGEAVDLAVVDDQSPTGKKADAVEPRAGAIDVDAAKRDVVVHSGVHDDAVGAGNNHTRGHAFTGDRDRLRNRHGAKAAGIETVDFAARRGLRDRAGKGLARCGAAARVGVVADPRNPGAGLRLRRRGIEQSNQATENGQQRCDLGRGTRSGTRTRDDRSCFGEFFIDSLPFCASDSASRQRRLDPPIRLKEPTLREPAYSAVPESSQDAEPQPGFAAFVENRVKLIEAAAIAR